MNTLLNFIFDFINRNREPEPVGSGLFQMLMERDVFSSVLRSGALGFGLAMYSDGKKNYFKCVSLGKAKDWALDLNYTHVVWFEWRYFIGQ
jgi:hypothetical protein